MTSKKTKTLNVRKDTTMGKEIQSKEIINTNLVKKETSIVEKITYEMKDGDIIKTVTSEHEFDFNNSEDHTQLLSLLVNGHTNNMEELKEVKIRLETEIDKIFEDIYNELPFH